jgi:L-asparaginase
MTLRKKILLIHTGGTLGMNLTGQPEDTETFLGVLRKKAPHIFEIADISIDVLFNKDSSNIAPKDWIKLAKKIDASLPHWDGIVVTHGTDTMAFTASVLSFMFEGLNKPVILTGSQLPMSDQMSDAIRNLSFSVQLACEGQINEVCIFFDSHLLRGNRSKKISIPSFKAFESPNYSPLATVGVKTTYSNSRPVPTKPYRFDPRLETQILSLSLFPGINAELFYPIIEQGGIKGLVLQAFGPGDIPMSELGVVHLIRNLTLKGIPTVICSQAIYGTVDLGLYETGRAARDVGAVSAGDMTWEAIISKMMVLLGRGYSLGHFRDQFVTDMAGEISPQKSLG